MNYGSVDVRHRFIEFVYLKYYIRKNYSHQLQQSGKLRNGFIQLVDKTYQNDFTGEFLVNLMLLIETSMKRFL